MKASISLLLLFVFGFSLTAEIFAPHFDNAYLESSLNSAPDNEIHVAHCEEQAVHDFCSMGICHWGHCPFVVRVGKVVVANQGFILSFIFFQQSLYHGPDLAGLRRPPRAV